MQKLHSCFPTNLVRILRFSTAISSRPDFLPSYLVAKCGLSPDKAAKAAKLVPRKVSSPDQPDSVIAFFKSHGFDDSHLTRVISSNPRALALDVEKTLSPRFQAFRELGFRGVDLITLVYTNPNILDRSMENLVLPKIELWRSLLGSHASLMKCLTHTHYQIMGLGLDRIRQNASLLREYGLSDHQMSTILRIRPSIIIQKPGLLNELVSRVERLGLPRGSSNFHWALYSLSKVTDDNVRGKIALFKGFGWSEDDFTKAFREPPGFFTRGSKSLKEKMEFFVKEASCPPSYVALNPMILAYSLEKRIIPRVKVLKALSEKGLVSYGSHKLNPSLALNKDMFFERFINPYKKIIPELSELLSASS